MFENIQLRDAKNKKLEDNAFSYCLQELAPAFKNRRTTIETIGYVVAVSTNKVHQARRDGDLLTSFDKINKSAP